MQTKAQVLIRRKNVEKRTSLSRSRIYALLKEKKFPQPIRLGRMSVAWIESEISEWIAERISEFRKSNGGEK